MTIMHNVEILEIYIWDKQTDRPTKPVIETPCRSLKICNLSLHQVYIWDNQTDRLTQQFIETPCRSLKICNFYCNKCTLFNFYCISNEPYLYC